MLGLPPPILKIALVACLALALAGPLWGEPDDSGTEGRAYCGENTELADALRELAALIVDEMYEADLAVESAELAALRVQNEAFRGGERRGQGRTGGLSGGTGRSRSGLPSGTGGLHGGRKCDLLVSLIAAKQSTN